MGRIGRDSGAVRACGLRVYLVIPGRIHGDDVARSKIAASLVCGPHGAGESPVPKILGGRRRAEARVSLQLGVEPQELFWVQLIPLRILVGVIVGGQCNSGGSVDPATQGRSTSGEVDWRAFGEAV